METKTIIAIMAHPDDAEQFFGGTAKLLVDAGHRVIFVAMTDGRYGSSAYTPEEMIATRQKEAQFGAKLLGVTYLNLGFPDGSLTVSETTINPVATLIQQYDPDMIVTHPPEDYHPDHEATSQIAKGATWQARLVSFTSSLPLTTKLIALYYTDPEGAVTSSGQFAPVSSIVALTQEIFHLKMQAFTRHVSQMSMDKKECISHETRTERIGIARGLLAGGHDVYGEGFRQDMSFNFLKTKYDARFVG